MRTDTRSRLFLEGSSAKSVLFTFADMLLYDVVPMSISLIFSVYVYGSEEEVLHLLHGEECHLRSGVVGEEGGPWEGFASAEELSLLVPRVFVASDVDLLVILGDPAPFAHLFDAGTDLHL